MGVTRIPIISSMHYYTSFLLNNQSTYIYAIYLYIYEKAK
jgi:hypothetical protein